jgi:hypothetical protein
MDCQGRLKADILASTFPNRPAKVLKECFHYPLQNSLPTLEDVFSGLPKAIQASEPRCQDGSIWTIEAIFKNSKPGTLSIFGRPKNMVKYLAINNVPCE